MARKSRRARKQGRPVRLSQSQMVMPQKVAPQVEAVAVPVAAVAARPDRVQEVNLAEEYHYVIADLKRIGLIALAMLLLLIVLAFLLT